MTIPALGLGIAVALVFAACASGPSLPDTVRAKCDNATIAFVERYADADTSARFQLGLTAPPDEALREHLRSCGADVIVSTSTLVGITASAKTLSCVGTWPTVRSIAVDGMSYPSRQ